MGIMDLEKKVVVSQVRADKMKKTDGVLPLLSLKLMEKHVVQLNKNQYLKILPRMNKTIFTEICRPYSYKKQDNMMKMYGSYFCYKIKCEIQFLKWV